MFLRVMCLRRFVGLLVAMVPAVAAAAGPRLEVAVGYGGLYRVGDWTPVYVTVTTPAPTAPDARPAGSPPVSGVRPTAPGTGLPVPRARLEAFAYQDARFTLLHTAEIPLAPGSSVFLMPVRMGALLEAHSLILREVAAHGPGQILAHVRFGDLPAEDARLVTTPTRLVLTSGTPTGELAPGDLVGRFLPLQQLPEHAELYESLDLLTLSGGDLDKLTPAQWSAIRQWVLSGGRLLLCLPPEGIPEDAPVLGWAGIRQGPLTSFSPTLTGREILPTQPDVLTVPLPGDLTGTRRRFGLGEVLASPVLLTVDTRPAMAELVGNLPPRIAADDPMPPRSATTTLPGLAGVAIVLGLLIGPLDLILHRSRPCPTRTHWVQRVTHACGFLALGGGLVLASLSRTEARPPELTLIDQIGSQPVAVTRLGVTDHPGSFPHPLLPADYPGTSHALLTTRLERGLPTAHRWPAGLVRISAVHPSVAQPTSLQVTAPPLRLSPRPSRAWVETARGAVPLDLDAGSTQVARPAQLPADLAAARRLTPYRSGKLQQRLSAGDLSLIWAQQEDRVWRIAMPANP